MSYISVIRVWYYGGITYISLRNGKEKWQVSKQDQVNTQTHSVESRAVFHYSALAKSAIHEVYTTQINTPHPPLNKKQCPLADLDSHWSIPRRMSLNMARESWNHVKNKIKTKFVRIFNPGLQPTFRGWGCETNQSMNWVGKYIHGFMRWWTGKSMWIIPRGNHFVLNHGTQSLT